MKFNKKKFKEFINSPYVQATTITGSTVGTTAAIYRAKKEKEYHKEEKKELNKILKHINKLDESVSNNNIEKKFSIQGGNKEANIPESITSRALKYTANNSIFNSENKDNKSNILIKIYRELDGVLGKDYVINSINDYDSSLSLYYGGNVIVFYLNNSDIIDKMNIILDNYCKTYKQADYSSTSINTYGNLFLVELNIIENTEKHLIYSFLRNNLKVNIIV